MEDLFVIEYYETDNGKCPYFEWEAELSKELRAQIRKRFNRVRLGNFGDFDHIEGNIYELRFHVGAGYRIYYAKIKNKIVILLCGGEKRTQKRDIEKARKYWFELEDSYGKNKKL